MANKKFWWGILVFGLVLAGCDTDDDGTEPPGDYGVKLPEVYRNTTWKNTPQDDSIGEGAYTKISFKTTSAVFYRDNGPITDNTGTVFNVQEIGPNNYYTGQLGTDVSQIIMRKPVPPSPPGEDSPAPAMEDIYIFVKDDGTGILARNSGDGGSPSEESWQDWVKQP